MQNKIITVPFDDTLKGFNDKIISDFCLNKKVYQIKSSLIKREKEIYWTYSIIYDELLSAHDKEIFLLTETEQTLYNKLRDWRRERAEKKGFPAYMVCNNAHIRQIVQNKCMTLESLKHIKGFGKAKITDYGKEIIEIVRIFFEVQKQEVKPPLTVPKQEIKSEEIKDKIELK